MNETPKHLGSTTELEIILFIMINYLAISFYNWHSYFFVGEAPMKQHTNNSMRRSPESIALVGDRRALGFSWQSL